MKRLLPIGIVALAALTVLPACNSKLDDTDDTIMAQSVAVNAFRLSEDNKIMAHLDTVFFAVDLISKSIYNADSLPYGSPTNKLVPVVSVGDMVSVIEFTVSRPDKPDTIYDYLAHPADSIDFSNGPVKMRVVSGNGLVEMTYNVQVNVHEVEPDSLIWGDAAIRTLPTKFTAATRQKTSANSSAIYCLTETGGRYCLAKAPAPDGEWEMDYVQMPPRAVTNSFTAAENRLYILGVDDTAEGNALYYSEDGGQSWTPTPIHMENIYGALGAGVCGPLYTEGQWLLASSSTSALIPLPQGMPVAQYSNPAYYSFPLSTGTQLLIVGGVDSDGNPCGAWSYDGNGWVRLSAPFAAAYRQMNLISFVSFTVNNALIPREWPTMYAFGGRNVDGHIERTVYRSTDYGMTWKEAPSMQQIPETITLGFGAQAFVYNRTLLPSRSADTWEPIAPRSRATRPIESWECPYIYVFGGYNESVATYNTIWRATLNRLTFKPMQ